MREEKGMILGESGIERDKFFWCYEQTLFINNIMSLHSYKCSYIVIPILLPRQGESNLQE